MPCLVSPMGGEWLVVLLSLGAALAFAASSSLKHVSAGQIESAVSLTPGKVGGLVRATVSHRWWVSGLAFDVIGLGLQVVALHLGALVVVQPLLVTSLVFAIFLRHRMGEHAPLTRPQIAWTVVLCGALAGLLLLAGGSHSSVQEKADHVPALVVGLVGGAVAVACIELGRRQRSAALTGVAVGAVYAATAAMLKGLTDVAARNPLDVFVSWQLYAVIVLGAAGLLLTQLAFQGGPITASLPATATVDPFLSMVIGVVVYDEPIRRGVGAGLGLGALCLLLGVAVVQLARMSAEEQGAGDREQVTTPGPHPPPPPPR